VTIPQFITYITSNADRWDLLAWKFYGDPMLFGPIVMANPGVQIDPVLPAGLMLVIPLRQKASIVAANLPPWKRSNS
jgi:phage tail protein X